MNYFHSRSLIVISVLIFFAFSLLAAPIGFLGDDLRYLYEIQNRQGSIAELITYVVQPLGTAFVWRPFINLIWLFEYTAFGMFPLPYHIVSVLLFVASGICGYAILTRYVTKKIALASIAFFFLMPMHYEVTLWLSGRTDAWAFFFVLLSLFTFIRFFETRKAVWRFCSWLAFLFGLFSKEFALVTPLVIALYAFLFQRRTMQSFFGFVRFFYAQLAGYACIAALYIGLRFFAVGSLVASDPSIAASFHVIPTLTELRAFVHRMSFLFNLSTFSALNESLARFWNAWSMVIAASGLCALFVLNGFQMKSAVFWKRIGFAIAFAVLLAWPVFSLMPHVTTDLKHSRFLYAPSFGIALLLGILLFSEHARRSIRWIQRTLFGVLCALFVFALVINATPWHEASRLQKSVVQDLARFDSIVQTQQPITLYVHRTPGEYRGAYVYHEYYSFFQAVRNQYKNPNITVKSVGTIPVKDPEFCASVRDRSAVQVVEWQKDHFARRPDVVRAWAEADARPFSVFSDYTSFMNAKPEVVDMAVQNRDGTLVLTQFGKNPSIRFLLPSVHPSLLKSVSLGLESVFVSSVRLSWASVPSGKETPFNRIAIPAGASRDIQLCAYPNWVVSYPITSIRISFPSFYSKPVVFESFGFNE